MEKKDLLDEEIKEPLGFTVPWQSPWHDPLVQRIEVKEV